MSFLTCFWLLPQKEHLSRSPPSPMRATRSPSLDNGPAGERGRRARRPVPVPRYDGTAYIGLRGLVTEANDSSARRVAPRCDAPSPVWSPRVTHTEQCPPIRRPG